MVSRLGDPRIDVVEAWAFVVPNEAGPQSDGTYEWTSTTAVVVEVAAGDARGLGYTYTHLAALPLIADHLAPALLGRAPLARGAAYEAMLAACRNLGRPGLALMAVSACDAALWDLAGRLLGRPLADLLGRVRDEVPVYGSGGFCSMDPGALRRQLVGWVQEGIGRVKLKIGREPARDLPRVAAAREVVGPGVGLMVDANGALERKRALALAGDLRGLGVDWLEEPVPSDDLDGLRLLRDRAPPGLEVAAGEYGWDPAYFRRMLAAGAVDVLQPDATRCGGPTGFLQAVAVARAFGVPCSTHTAPTLHAHLAAASAQVRHLEYFSDHVRVEGLLFDGAVRARGGRVRPDPSRPGLGIELRRADAARLCAAHARRGARRVGAGGTRP
ncbi:MAG: mandelate racemase [Planctomycetes bacterium]|nr:mandelate racemase [Planctomycetota bacterium]